MRRLLLALVVILVPGVVLAQGLGDVAARERQKRESAGHREKPRVLSNDDLPKAGDAAKPAEAPAPEASSPLTGNRDRREDEADPAQAALEQAQAQVDAARAAVVAAEEHLKELQDKLNPMSGSFIYGATGSNSANEELQVRAQTSEAETQLAGARDALVKATQAYEDTRLRRTAPPE